MKLLYLLRSKIGWDIDYKLLDNNEIDISSISIKFNNDKANQHLKNIISKEIATKKDIEMYESMAVHYEWEKNLMYTMLDDEQRKTSKDKTGL